MAESEGEIEYLEEDAEIVQQCVQSSSMPVQPEAKPIVLLNIAPQTRSPTPSEASLLVERPKAQKRKKKEEEDSEYDPSDDNLPPSPPSPPSPPMRKKRVPRSLKKSKLIEANSVSPYLVKSKTIILHNIPKENHLSAKEQLLIRKKYNIHIPDYADPLCLPVRAIKLDESDNKRLNNWNNVCMEHFKHCDTILKSEQGVTKRSVRTAVFRNVVNKQSGNTETTIWSKTCVENEDSDKKSEIFQCVLPRYKEKKVLGDYLLGTHRHRTSFTHVDEVILSRENHKDGDALVVYKPKESLSAVYGLIDTSKKSAESEETEATHSAGSDPGSVFLKELAACKICPSCFQSSWRGIKKQKAQSPVCPICGRASVTVYNLLSHFKSHSASDVIRYKKMISSTLADIVGYHYKCRVCRKQFESIKALRHHIVDHRSLEMFTCEVCNRLVNEKKIV